jgi:hypothetical protein
MRRGIGICDIVELLRQSDGNEELLPTARARLVMRGIKQIITDCTGQYEENILGYLISQADKYLKSAETPEAAIIAQEMQENLVYKKAARGGKARSLVIIAYCVQRKTFNALRQTHHQPVDQPPEGNLFIHSF